jgi:hypothetical protein
MFRFPVSFKPGLGYNPFAKNGSGGVVARRIGGTVKGGIGGMKNMQAVLQCRTK